MTHKTSIELMKFLAQVARKLGVGNDIYVVGGSPRNFMLDPTGLEYPIKDIDVVTDASKLGKDASAWFAKEVQKAIPVDTSLVTNQYGVAILTIKGEWIVEGQNLQGEAIEIANARKESYGEGGYKPDMVEPATIEEDTIRREFTFNTLLWRLQDVAQGPDKAEIIDLTGCGLKDLQEGSMRCPRDPDIVFTDDPSRMVRAIKFAIKYGFKVPPDVKASILRNRDGLKNIPPGHLSNMIIGVFFEGGYGKEALLMMRDLGLLDVVKEIAQDSIPFREALANWADRSAALEFVFDLMDLGMPVGSRITFLDDRQRDRLREITVKMTADESNRFVEILKQPGNILDMLSLIGEFNLKGMQIKKLTTTIRQVLLDEPELVHNEAKLSGAIRDRMADRKIVGQVVSRFAGKDPGSYFEVGDKVFYGKYKNKVGIVKGFKRDPKGNPMLVIEPFPKGRKQDKEIGLYRMWHMDVEKRASVHAEKLPAYLDKYSNILTKMDNEYYAITSLNLTSEYGLKVFWASLIMAGRDLVQAVMEVKAIPQKFAKKFEIAARVISSARRMPHGMIAWWGKVSESFHLVLDAAKDWPDKTDADVTQRFKVGPFTVINTVNLPDKGLQEIKDVFERAIQDIRSLKYPADFEKVLYGEVFVVGRINQAKTLAWYKFNDDMFYVRPLLGKKGISVLENIIHELGHRYISKFMSPTMRKAWVHYYYQMKGSRVDVELPKEGDFLPIKIKTPLGIADQPSVKKVEFGKYWFELGGEDFSIGKEIVKGFLAKVEVSKGFPTVYAMKDPEEHFCEAVSKRATGTLGSKIAESFDKIFSGRDADETPNPVKVTMQDITQKVARRYMRAKWEEKIDCGRAEGKDPSEFDLDALLKGQKVEMEHTCDPQVAMEIAMDHLTEFPDYYDGLAEMENELKKEQE